jgi:hypothetical protein
MGKNYFNNLIWFETIWLNLNNNFIFSRYFLELLILEKKKKEKAANFLMKLKYFRIKLTQITIELHLSFVSSLSLKLRIGNFCHKLGQ